MPKIELAFASGEDTLTARRFSVHEQMSALFHVSAWAMSPNDDIDLETIVGQPASLRIANRPLLGEVGAVRRWGGVCASMEQVRSESAGLSTYHLRIAPKLWLLTQKRDHRLFQHKSIPEIVGSILDQWKIPHELRLEQGDHPKLDLRSQYGETDHAFVCRLLEEAGISYFFEDAEKDDSKLILCDTPQDAEPRASGPLPYVPGPTASTPGEFVTALRLSQDVRPGRVTFRDFDFRRSPTFKLLGATERGKTVEDLLEQYAYAPGSFLVEQARPTGGLAGKAAGAVDDKVTALVDEKVTAAVTKQVSKVAGEKIGGYVGGAVGDVAGSVAGDLAGKLAGTVASALGRLVGDDKGYARFDERVGKRKADVALESMRASRRRVAFETNTIDLAPGVVMQIDKHPRKDLASDKRLLVTESTVEGSPNGEWTVGVQATFADLKFRPPQTTPKPQLLGLQSAVVVGPRGEEIHTDEHGRVRVQFHWDRQGGFDDDSSCWMRVSQGWAGPGFGMISIPRVGQEVLVAFLEGDPDHPVVVGRLFNETAPVPYDLPANKTKSGWKSDSSPGSGGYNEISFEDAKGRELVYMQAERNLETLVKQDEARAVGGDRRTNIGAVDASIVGSLHVVTMKQAKQGELEPTTFEMVDRRIRFTTGEASLTLDGPNITLEAKGRIFVHSTDDDVEILGGPWVKINCGPVKEGESDTVTMHHIAGVVRDSNGKPLAGRKVVVKGSDGALQQVETDSSGKYFALVPPGKCQVRLSGAKFYEREGAEFTDWDDEPEEFDDCGPAA